MIGRTVCPQTLHEAGQLGQAALKGRWQVGMAKQDTGTELGSHAHT